MLKRKLTLISIFISISGCDGYRSQNINFCDQAGRQIYDVYFNKELELLNIGDGHFRGKFHCSDGFTFCFNSKSISLNILKNYADHRSIDKFSWGSLIWTTDQNGRLILNIIRKKSDTQFYMTCEPLL